MRTISAIIVVVCVIGIMFLPYPLSEQGGVYNTFSELYWCERCDYCTHEIGHKLDQESNWKSGTQDFRNAIRIFIGVESRLPNPSPLLKNIFETPEFSMTELYAEIFRVSGGSPQNIPESFRKFYDWKRAQELIERERLCQR